MTSRPASRILAPLSLVASATAVAVIVAGSGSSAQTSSASEATPPPRPPAKSNHHFWIVRSGQTLTEISTRTGVPIATLQRLNPGADLQSLQLGQRVKVR